MNGAELMVQTAAAAGIEVCFTNPGTTELPLVEAFDSVEGVRPVLGLFEGCCAGAADGYARLTDKPAMTLFHLGPGFSNAIANLHNARRARSPVLNIIGDHATWHQDADAPLTMDINALARTVSGWTRTGASIEALSRDTAQAIAAAREGCVATLIMPHDIQWSEISHQVIHRVEQAATLVDVDLIKHAANLLRQSEAAVMVLGGRALRQEGLKTAARIQNKTGCALLSETFPAHMARGAGLPAIERIPYAPTAALNLLSQYDSIVLAGAKAPVAFFGYRNGPSRLLTADQKSVDLEMMGSTHIQISLESLADALDAPQSSKIGGNASTRIIRPKPQSGSLTPKKIGAVIAALQPENAIVVEEAVTSGVGYYGVTSAVPPFSLLTLTGGAIGQGMPCAVGAAMACPDRPVIDFQADGSAMYTLQALWMQAREGLNITTLICANQRYRILEAGIAQTGNLSPGVYTRSLTDLSNPSIDWVDLSKGMGVPAVSVETVEELTRHLGKSLNEPGPFLIEMRLG